MFCVKYSGQIVLNNGGNTKRGTTDLESIVTDLNLDTGLGVFDAFFASLSMILVSEVCASSWTIEFWWIENYFLRNGLYVISDSRHLYYKLFSVLT